MKTIHRLTLLAIVCVAMAATVSAQPASTATKPSEPTLYERIGAYNALASVVDDFIEK